MRTREARVVGFMPDEVTGVGEMSKGRWLNEEGKKLVEGFGMAYVWMESARCFARAALFIVDGVRF